MPSTPRVLDKDLLGRRVMAQALADQLFDHATGPRDADPGPTVVTIEGPWGSGKSTLLDLVRHCLPPPRTAPVTLARLTVRVASGLLRRGEPAAYPPPATTARGVVSAWFNPWAHQSGEQVWAGLVAEIIEAVRPVLYPTENARERYWFVRNLSRVDRYALRRTLHRRVLSPALTVGALGIVASLAISIAELETAVHIAGNRIGTALIALFVAAGFLLVGALHTGWRYLRGAAARFLPGELFHGPVTLATDMEAADPSLADGLTDPLRRARAGSLYLHQHDVSELVADLDRAGYELIVFVDDLDRCRALTTAEVFEAINLFLAGFISERRRTGRENPGEPGSSLRARFVIGLDPVVVARHLDRVYADLQDPTTLVDREDPSPGWAFLRQLVHLPILLPQVSDGQLFQVVDQIAGVQRRRRRRTLRRAAGEWWQRPWHPELRALIRQRLTAQPDRSLRDATRLLNAWLFYERVLATSEPIRDESLARARSRHLIVLAEIVTRWPSLQRFLHRRTGSRTGLQLLAAAAGGPEWPTAAREVLAGCRVPEAALTALEHLLRDHDGGAVADLAARLF